MSKLTPWNKENDRQDLAPRHDIENSPWLQLHREFDDLFDRFFGRMPMLSKNEEVGQRMWGFDLDDREDEMVVRAEVPGFAPEEIDVSIQNGTLFLKAEHKEETEGENQHSRRSSQYFRQITLPSAANEDDVNAQYNNGVLEIHLPKREEVRAKRISVRT